MVKTKSHANWYLLCTFIPYLYFYAVEVAKPDTLQSVISGGQTIKYVVGLFYFVFYGHDVSWATGPCLYSNQTACGLLDTFQTQVF